MPQPDSTTVSHVSLSRTPEYGAWYAMIDRCSNTANHAYKDYGGRGITVCDEWVKSFPVFLSYIGPRPSSDYTLDRFPDNNGNYEPGNVRWATRKQQSRNTRASRIITAFGVTKPRIEWAEIYGMTNGTLISRLSRGTAIEEALTETPHQGRRPSEFHEAFGEKKTILEWAESKNMKWKTLDTRMRLGWGLEQALTVPVRKVNRDYRLKPTRKVAKVG